MVQKQNRTTPQSTPVVELSVAAAVRDATAPKKAEESDIPVGEPALGDHGKNPQVIRPCDTAHLADNSIE